MPVMKALDEIRIVLDHTSHPGNIGAAARAMKVMGLDRLHLVEPADFPNAQATAMASSADDLLDRAQVHSTLVQALEGCTLVLGTSARRRTVTQELLEPREAAARALEESGPVAVVFGCEKSGLDNAALDRCHALVSIPTGVDYMSLNLAQAVQVLCYELHMTARAGERRIPSRPGCPLLPPLQPNAWRCSSIAWNARWRQSVSARPARPKRCIDACGACFSAHVRTTMS